MSTAVHRGGRAPNYDRYPVVAAGTAGECDTGWQAIAARLRGSDARVIVVDAYPGVREIDLQSLVRALEPATVVRAADALRPEDEIETMIAPDLTDDPVFGRLTRLELSDFFVPDELDRLRARVDDAHGTVVVYGSGAALVTTGDVLIHADMPRREIQQRQRRGEIASIGASRPGELPSREYKRGYFVDWRVCDRHKRRLWDRMDFVLDTTRADRPYMISSQAMFRGLREATRRPFRVVPLFDPAPWGGQWMKEVCDLPRETVNYGWCFDCVPEENSLLLGFGEERVEIPAINLVLRHPTELLGEAVRARFGSEFPIRFDFLDTIEGGNLSLQVHPGTDYMREHFGLHYSQDESYYILDADDGATVYLGVKSGVDRDAMIGELRRSEQEGLPFPVERYVNRLPARRHDHFLIPTGTVHCAGAGSLVLEISATPYIFTFKLWDWGRPGLDGRPRPIHIDHGERNIRFERDTDYTTRNLINRVAPLQAGDGWKCERTGLHEAEFVETHRHWFTAAVAHDTGGGVNVLNLVEGEEAVVESPDDAFEPFTVHYAETFIVPAAVGRYSVRPTGKRKEASHATIKAFVRSS